MIPLILCISLMACTLGGVAKKYVSDRYGERDDIRHLYNGACGIVAAVIFVIWGGLSAFSGYTLLLGAVFGIVITVQQLTNLKALECGPLSLTTVLISLSSLIPAVSGALFWNEAITWSQIVGMVLLVVCLFFSAEGEGEEKKTTLKWLLYCLFSFITNGLIGVMQKIHQSSAHAAELNEFLIVAFAVTFLYSAIAYLWSRSRRKKTDKTAGERKLTWPTVLVFLAAGVFLAVNHKLNLYLSGVLPSALLFPVLNGAGLVLTTLVAIIFFRERLSGRRWIGLAVGIAAVVFLCDPFALIA